MAVEVVGFEMVKGPVENGAEGGKPVLHEKENGKLEKDVEPVEVIKGIDGSIVGIQSRTASKSRDGSGMKVQQEARKVFDEGFNEGVWKKQGFSSSESLPRGKEARGECAE